MKTIVLIFSLLFSLSSFADSTFEEAKAVKEKYAPIFKVMNVAYGIGFCDQIQDASPDCHSIAIRISSEKTKKAWVNMFGSIPFQLDGVWVEMKFMGDISARN